MYRETWREEKWNVEERVLLQNESFGIFGGREDPTGTALALPWI